MIWTNEEKLFFCGAKPGLLVDTQEKDNFLIKKYPNITYKGGSLFFNNEKLKKQFLENTSGKKITHYDIGIALGYPPKACEYFQETAKNPWPQKSVFVQYHGIVFRTSYEIIDGDFEWLFNNIIVPKHLKKFISIGIQRIDNEKLYEYLRIHKHQIPQIKSIIRNFRSKLIYDIESIESLSR